MKNKNRKRHKPKKPWGRSRFCKRMAKIICYYRDHYLTDTTKYHWGGNKHCSWQYLETLSHMLACYASQHVTYGGVETEWAFESLGLWEWTTNEQMKRRLRGWYSELLLETEERSAFKLYAKKLHRYILGSK